MSLCQKCRSIRIPKLNDAAADGDGDRGHYGEAKRQLENGGNLGAVGSTVVRHTSVGSLAMSVAEGCVICGLVWEGLSEEQRDVVVVGGGGGDCAESGLEAGTENEIEAGTVAFEGIEYTLSMRCSVFDGESDISYIAGRNGGQDRGGGRGVASLDPIVAKIQCRPVGDDLYDVEDYNVVGGWFRAETGTFAVLNPMMFPANEVPDLSPTTNDPKCWKTVARWIRRCQSQHKLCKEAYYQTDATWMPKRVVDVSQYTQGYIRVISTATLAPSSSSSSSSPTLAQTRQSNQYLALSHCWGTTAFLTYTAATAAAFKRGMAVSALAQNFQDAIATTHRLGFRYLWIDSLCIKQGSQEDWAEQAPQMNKVYRNAFLTLAAVASKNAEGGFFRDRDPQRVKPFPVPSKGDGKGEDKESHAREQPQQQHLVIKADFWEKEVLQAPLSKRAWVVQERLLAPRSLYFGESQLYWECHESHACEVFPDGVPRAFISEIEDTLASDAAPIKAFRGTASALAAATKDSDNDHKLNDSDSAISLDNSPKHSSFGRLQPGNFYDNPYEVWNEVLHSYVKCALTKPEDKLVALSGVAKDFVEALSDDYLAGLWRKDLISGLLWHIAPQNLTGLFEAAPARHSIPYRAPSWSWASVESPHVRAHTMPLLGRIVDCAMVEGVSVVPKVPGDGTGQVSHACLRMKGYLVKTRRRPVRISQSRSFGEFHPDTKDLVGDEFYCCPLFQHIQDDAMWTRSNELKGLVLGVYSESEEDEAEDNTVQRTSCEKCAGKKVYTRVGTFESEQGDPLQFLGMRKPRDWEEMGEESDHLWFEKDLQKQEFFII